MNHFNDLNEQQQHAAQIIEGPVLVLAGAGSGKTRVVTYRIVHLIESGIPPSSILGLTFTNKAAGEMRDRVTKMTHHAVLISTFHSLGARILRESIHLLGYKNNFTIYDDEDSDKLIKACLLEIGFPEKIEAKPFKYLISKAKNDLKLPHEIQVEEIDSNVEKAFPQVYALYQQKLKEYDAVDFDDLLFLVVKLWSEHPGLLSHYQKRWPFVLIDEYQDTNAAQYTMIHLLVEKNRNIFVVGDPDQSIYSWRGANVKNIMNFEKDYPGAKVIELAQNYRSYSNILDAANSLIRHNENRYEKDLWSDRGIGESVKLFIGEDDREEADFVIDRIQYFHDEKDIPYRDMVIFYRTNAQSRIFEDYCIHHGIKYVIVGGISFYQRREVKDILSFLRIVHSDSDFISFARTINLPKRGFGDQTIEKIRVGSTVEGMPIFTFCEALVNGEASMKLSAKQKESLTEYVQVILELRNLSLQGSIRDVVLGAIEKTGYLNYLKLDPDSYQDRKENLDELITKALEWEMTASPRTLGAFLEEFSLKSNLDEVEGAEDRINLMTIHNGKGLEFTAVFMVGLEEDLFPHIHAKGMIADIEEERRLCYVGMTRAKEYLFLSACYYRYLWGNLRMQRPSRFIREISQEYLENYRRIEQDVPVMKYPVREPKTSSKITPLVQHHHAPSTEKFVVGDAVFHKDFGIGQINEIYEGDMGLTYKIYFSNEEEEKTLVAKYAFLKKLV